ncbi:MAG: LamG-like jellyroll fold domain-containing protein [Flavobacteriales bacterium]
MKHHYATSFAVLFSSTLMAQVPAWLPANELVAWYPFSGNAIDESGNGHDLVVNGATLSADRHGLAASAYTFNGSSNHMNGGSSPAFEILGDRTLSVWIRPGVNLPDDQGIVGYIGSSGPLAGHAGYYLKRRLPGNGILAAYEDSALWGSGQYGAAWSDAAYGPGQWHHLVHWRSGGTTYLYVDGVLQSSSYTLTPYFLNSEFLVGWSGSAGQYFHGEIDDIGLWDRALTPGEIQQVYQGGGPTGCLIASYPLDGNALDATNNDHDGSVFGATDAIGHDGGGCYHFDGTDDFIKLAGTWAGLNGTITAWINPDELTQFNPIFSRRDTTVNGSALELVVNINEQPDSSKLYKGTDFRDCAGGGDLFFRTSTIVIQAGIWTCVAMTADEIETKLYINGVEVATYGDLDPGYWFENMCPGGINTYIGMSSRPLNTEYFKGRIDDVQVYDCALSASEIASLCDLTTSVTQQQSPPSTLYPNPSTGIIHLSPLPPNTEVQVFDAIGRIHYSERIASSGALSIDLSELANGTYFVRAGGDTWTIVRN